MELQFDLTPHVYGQKILSIADEENEMIAKAITLLLPNMHFPIMISCHI